MGFQGWIRACIAVAALACGYTAAAVPQPEGVLAQGTEFETPYYRMSGKPADPVVLILGGVHGDEPAGYRAARILLHGRVRRGTLVIVPEVSRPAIRRGVREHGGSVSYFYGDPYGPPREQLIADLWSLIRRVDPDLGLTLHESRDFHWRNPARYGQTFTHDVRAFDDVIGRAMGRANRHIPEPKHRFSLFVKPIAQCFTWVVSTQLQRPATTVETCRLLPLKTRIRYQLLAVRAFLDETGVEYDNGNVPTLEGPRPAPQPPPPSPWRDLLANGDFSRRLEGWAAAERTVLDVGVRFRGRPSVRAAGDGGIALARDVPVAGPARFLAEVWVRARDAGAPSLRVALRDSVGNVVGEPVVGTTLPVMDGGESQWFLIRVVGDVPAVAGNVRVELVPGPALAGDTRTATWFAAAQFLVQHRGSGDP